MSDLLPDLAPRVITWSDAINVVIAAVGVYIAYLGGKLAKQQTELAAKADRISSVQLGRAAQAEVHSVMTYDLGGTLRDVGIQLRNVGVADIEGFSWHLSTRDDPARVICRDSSGKVLKPEAPLNETGDVFYSGHRFNSTHPGTVRPDQSVLFATFDLDDDAVATSITLHFGYWIKTKYRGFGNMDSGSLNVLICRHPQSSS